MRVECLVTREEGLMLIVDHKTEICKCLQRIQVIFHIWKTHASMILLMSSEEVFEWEEIHDMMNPAVMRRYKVRRSDAGDETEWPDQLLSMNLMLNTHNQDHTYHYHPKHSFIHSEHHSGLFEENIHFIKTTLPPWFILSVSLLVILCSFPSRANCYWDESI